MRAAGLLPPRLAALAAALAGLALAGCGSTTSGTHNQGVTVAGSTLTIWASQPPGDSGGQVATDVLDAERLAFSQTRGKVGTFHLRIRVAHDREVSADARQAVSDNTAIAYLGEIEPGASGVSVQITNELGLLQVSPTDTAAYLTQATSAVKNSPQHFYPAHGNFGETFARVVPDTVVEAKAIVARIRADGVRTLDVADDGTPYGVSVAAEVRSAASAAGLSVTANASGADGAFYGGLPDAAARRALDADAAAGAHVKLYAPSAIYDPEFVATLSTAAQAALTVSSPGFVASQLTPAGRAFETAFQSAYHRAPVPQAIFGYEAMRAVIAALSQAGSHAATRETVVHDFRDLRRSASASAIGAYAINGGDTDLAPFVFATVADGKLVPHAAG